MNMLKEPVAVLKQVQETSDTLVEVNNRSFIANVCHHQDSERCQHEYGENRLLLSRIGATNVH
jgi:hypothetical protein